MKRPARGGGKLCEGRLSRTLWGGRGEIPGLTRLVAS